MAFHPFIRAQKTARDISSPGGEKTRVGLLPSRLIRPLPEKLSVPESHRIMRKRSRTLPPVGNFTLP